MRLQGSEAATATQGGQKHITHHSSLGESGNARVRVKNDNRRPRGQCKRRGQGAIRRGPDKERQVVSNGCQESTSTSLQNNLVGKNGEHAGNGLEQATASYSACRGRAGRGQRMSTCRRRVGEYRASGDGGEGRPAGRAGRVMEADVRRQKGDKGNVAERRNRVEEADGVATSGCA